MRLIQKLLFVVLALLAALTLWYYVGGALSARVTTASAQASDYASAFQAAAAIVRSGAAHQVFDAAGLDAPDGYQLLDINISLKNNGLFAAEWLELVVSPGAGDAAVYSVSGLGGDVSPFGTGNLNLKLITTDVGAARTATISYYVLGMRRSVTVPLQ